MFKNIDSLFFSFVSFILIFILYLNCVNGIDLTDEIQYYLQLKSLLETGELFINDLFFQQTIYVLFYPIFLLSKSFFGYEAFFLSGRVIFSLVLFLVFVVNYRILKRYGLSDINSSITSLSMSLAIPAMGIYAISYNSFTQIIWTLFLVQFFCWSKNQSKIIYTLPLFALFSNPFAAGSMLALICTRLLVNKEFKQLLKALFIQILGFMFCLFLLLEFSSFKSLLDSIHFSFQFSIGSAFFSSIKQILVVLSIPLIYVILGFIKKNKIVLDSLFLITIATSIIVITTYGFLGYEQNKLIRTCALIAIMILIHIRTEKIFVDIEIKERVTWLYISIITFCSFSLISSSNGLNQIFGPVLISIPLLIGLWVNLQVRESSLSNLAFLGRSNILIFPLVIILNSSLEGYREEGWIKTNQEILGVPEFKFLFTSMERKDFINTNLQEFGQDLNNKKALIISNKPALYFITGSVPETCMIFLRESEHISKITPFARCMKSKNPELIITVSENQESEITSTIRKLFFKNFNRCKFKTIELKKNIEITPVLIKYEICLSQIN